MLPYNKKDHVHKKLAVIHGINDVERFLHPIENESYNPFLLKNIELASDRIIKAIHRNERISILGDVDNDGICATAIKYNYLRNFVDGDNISYFHNQRSQGHGINNSIHLVPKDVDLLIIVDSSSSDTEACEALNLAGIDVIILDHHPIEQENPFVILVNPQQEGCEYQNKNISGSVVAWKMCQVLDEVLDVDISDNYIDLAAIGLLGDQMNMLEYENRFIVQKGLDNIKNKGIKALLSLLGKDKTKLSSTDVLYGISPTLNAACRLDQIEIALSLLTEENPKIYKQLAEEIVKLNEQRKVTQAKYYNQLIDHINPSDKCSIIINNQIGAGYRGLLAGDLSNEFRKPVIIVSETEEDGTCKGSLRAYNNYKFKSFVSERIPHLIKVAGHESAAGVTFKRSDLNKIQAYLNEHLPSLDKDNHLEYILEFNLEDVDEDLIKNIEDFYRLNGNGFEVGKFKINNVFILDKKILGKESNTIKLECYPADKAIKSKAWGYDSLTPSHVLMKFRTNSDYIGDRYIYKEVEVVGTLNLNIYKNERTGKTTRTNQIFLEDYQLVY